MRRVIVSGNRYTGKQLEILKARFEVLHLPEPSDEELDEYLPGAEGYLLGGDERLCAQRLSAAPRLEVISFVGTGASSFVDMEAADAAGIQILTTPGANAISVAEHTLGLLLGVTRRLFADNAAVKAGGVPAQPPLQVAGLQVGIIGMGEIGRALTPMLKALGCDLSYFSRTRKPNIEAAYEIAYRPWSDILAWSEAICILLPTTADTKGIINASALALAKKLKFLINTAGAGLVDSVALRSAMQSRPDLVCGFDGYWTEPLPGPEEDVAGFLRMDDARFVVTPHVAGKTEAAWREMQDRSIAGLCRWWSA